MSYEEDYLKDQQQYEYNKMLEEADNAVAVAVGATALSCAVPIPLADAAMLITEQVILMAKICSIFKINVKKDGLKALATAALGAGGATVVGKTIATSLLKMIPGAGTIAGAAISAGTAGVVTLAMGKAFIEVCKASKMGLLSENEITSSKGVNMLKRAFKEQLKKDEVKADSNTNAGGKNESYAGTSGLFLTPLAVKNYASDAEPSGVIKELERRSAPDALLIEIYGKVLEGKVTVDLYCKLDGQEGVYKIVKMGHDGNLTERSVGQATKFTLKKI